MPYRPSGPRRVLVTAVTVLGLTSIVASGCTVGDGSGGSGDGGSSATSQQATPAALTVTPADGAKDVTIVDGVTAKVADGTLTKVVLTNDEGKAIDGTMSADKRAWKPAIPLGYGRTYTMTVTYQGEDAQPKTDKRTFQMANPSSVLTPEIVNPGGGTIESGREYGVGMVVGVRFDDVVKDKAAMEKLMTVTTDPPVEGAWYWLSDSTAHWRPKDYYATGTKVKVSVDTYGKNLGNGQFGGDNASTDFTIGKRRVSIADDNTKQVVVYENQKPIRTMPTSMGQGGYYGKLHFWTMPGIYTVMDKTPSVVMDSSTYGLPVNSPMGYKETIYNAVRISNDGIYLHRLDETVWAQGNTDTSHGCLNLNSENSRWYYDYAVTGDVVQVLNTGGPALEVWQGGDWSLPWDKWTKGGQKA